MLGVTAEYNFGRKSDSVQFTVFPDGAEDIDVSLKLKDSYAVLAHLGLLATPQMMVYGLFGYTWQYYTADLSLSGCCGSFGDSRSGQLGGLTFGIGGEWLINSQWSFKAEYRLVKLDAPGDLITCCTTLASFDKVDDHVFRGVLSFKLPNP